MRFDVVTIFPELIEAATACGLIGKALSARTLRLCTQNPRDFARDKHRSVDDAPYGGGSGMVMLPEPLVESMEALDRLAREAHEPAAKRILMTPQGVRFDQRVARRLAREPALMLICGRYEGIDARVSHFVHEEISLGDFVLNGGEVAALSIIDAVGRLVPGVVGNAASLLEESHTAGLLEYPQYTRPRSFRGYDVPEVLLGGNHAEIEAYREREAIRLTRKRRPDLLSDPPAVDPAMRRGRTEED